MMPKVIIRVKGLSPMPMVFVCLACVLYYENKINVLASVVCIHLSALH